MEPEISSWTANTSLSSRSNMSDQSMKPLSASVMRAVTRSRLPSRCTVPSRTCPTFKAWPISVAEANFSRAELANDRDVTRIPWIRASALISPLVIPSAR